MMSDALERRSACEVEAASAAAALDPPQADSWPFVDRRRGGDRRQRPTGILDVFRGFRRRMAGRRAHERHGIYVDRHHPREVALMVGVLVLNVLDALFTLLWMQRGGQEANPVMDVFIRAGDHFFLVQKCMVVGLCLVLLLLHKNFSLARRGMRWLFGLYLCILALHLVLLATGVQPPRPA